MPHGLWPHAQIPQPLVHTWGSSPGGTATVVAPGRGNLEGAECLAVVLAQLGEEPESHLHPPQGVICAQAQGHVRAAKGAPHTDRRELHQYFCVLLQLWSTMQSPQAEHLLPVGTSPTPETFPEPEAESPFLAQTHQLLRA